MPNPTINTMRMPDVTGIAQNQAVREVQNITIQKLKEEQQEVVRKKRIEAYDYALNVLASVNSPEDFAIAKKLLHTKYPETSDGIEQMLPTYNPTSIDMIRRSLRTDAQRMKEEEIKAFAPGSDLYKGDKKVGSVPTKEEKGDFELFEGPSGDQIYVKKGGPVPEGYRKDEKESKPDYEVFEGPRGEQRYVKKGDPIPTGFSKVQAKGTSVTVQTGSDLSKTTKAKLEDDIIQGMQNVKSFQGTKTMFKDEYLTMFGKGGNLVATIADKAGVSSDEQKGLIEKRAKWFRQAKADFIAFRKWATGVAGGEQELKELATAFPDPVNNSPTQYRANLDSIEETTKKVLALNAEILRSGIDLSQPLPSIMKQIKAAGLSIDTPGSGGGGGGTGVVVIQYDNQGNRIK